MTSNTILDKNKNWKVLDIGCGYNPHPKANTICDVQNLSSFYKDKKFIQLKEKTLNSSEKYAGRSTYLLVQTWRQQTCKNFAPFSKGDVAYCIPVSVRKYCYS